VLHAEKKVKIEEVPDINSVMVPEIKSKENIKKFKNVESVRKVVDVRPKDSKPKVDMEDSLVLSSDERS
jgi:hypothetical protein